MRKIALNIDQQVRVRASFSEPKLKFADSNLDDDGNGAPRCTCKVESVTLSFEHPELGSVDMHLTAMNDGDGAFVYGELTTQGTDCMESRLPLIHAHLNGPNGKPTPKFQKRSQSDITSDDTTEPVPA